MDGTPWLISLLFFHLPATAHSVVHPHLVVCVCCVRSHNARLVCTHTVVGGRLSRARHPGV